MMDIRPNLEQLFEAAFGVKSPIFFPSDLGLGKAIDGVVNPGARDVKYSGVQAVSEEKAKSLSWMGTPIIYQFKLKGGIFKTYNYRGELVDFPLPDFIMPVATLVDFSRSKNIIGTPVLGRQGTVNELFGFDDWSVRVRGVCLNEPNRKAIEQKKTLLKWEQVCGGVPVSGSLFSEKKIDTLVIRSMSFQQLEGQPYVMPFEMDCISDPHYLI